MDSVHLNMILNILTLVLGGGAVGIFIKTMADRGRVKIEAMNAEAKIETDRVLLTTKIENDLRGEAAIRFKEFRDEVHGLRGELSKRDAEALVRDRELADMAATSARRGDRMDMLLFILRMVMDEFHIKDPENKVLAQARVMLDRLGDEPGIRSSGHTPGASPVLAKAEDTVDKAKETVREVKATEAGEIDKGRHDL